MNRPTPKVSPRGMLRITILASMLLHACLLVWGIQRNSITFDEFWHVSSGVAYWKYGEFSICGISPPLLRMWAAAPIMLSGATVPPIENAMKFDLQSRHAVYAADFEQANYADLPRLYELARYALIPISLLGLWITAIWATELFGPRAGCGAAVLYAFCPNILAHAGLAGTDAGTMTAMLAALWLWWRCCLRPTTGRALLTGVAVGAAHLCKFTALLLWPAMVVIAAAVWLMSRDRGPARPSPARIGGCLGLTAALTLLLLNAGYGLRQTGDRIDSFAFKSKTCRLLAALPGWVRLPLPRDLVVGFDEQKLTAETAPLSFLLGRMDHHNNFVYYAVALACKLPLGVLSLAVLAAGAAIYRSAASRRRAHEQPTSPGASALPPAAALLVLALGLTVMSNFNIGIRYVLPIFPLGFILISSLWSQGARLRWVGSLLAGVLAIETLATAPRFLTFFNAAVGGPARGWKLLSDSNIDWGQGLRDLKDWMNQQHVERIQLWHFSFVDPGVYGIRFCPMRAACNDAYVAVSVCPLVGLAPIPEMKLPWHRQLDAKPRVAIVGNTFHIFKREDYDDARREYEYGLLK